MIFSCLRAEKEWFRKISVAWAVLGSVKVPSCPVCGEQLPIAPEDMTAPFSCEKCGSTLRASVRYRTAFLLIAAVAGALLRFTTLIFNPRFNPQKTAKFPFAMEALLTRLFWRTRLVKIALHRAPVANPNSEPQSRAV